MNQEAPDASPQAGRPRTSRIDDAARLAASTDSAEGLNWAAMAWFGALIVLLFAPVLRDMFKEYARDESMGHGFFVPVVVGYMIWQRRTELARVAVKPDWSGWALCLLGFLFLLLGTFGAEFSLMRGGLMLTVYGVVLATCGIQVFRMLAFPLLLLLFMIRIPQFIYGQITFPLQILASQFAEFSLSVLGIPVLREGNVLELASQKLNVVEACSGIRSLLSLTFLALVYGYFFETKKWIRTVLFLSTIPIAIFANGLRVTLTGVLSEVNKDYAEGVFHTMEGWVIFMVALVALLTLHQVLLRLARLSKRKAAAANV
jgi:exosortase